MARKHRGGFAQSVKDREGFWHYKLSYTLAKETYGDEIRESGEDFYARCEQNALEQKDIPSLIKSSLERDWMRSKKPFFRVWPKLTPYLLKLNDAKVTGDLIELPYPVFGVFFRHDERSVPVVPGYPVRSMLFGWPRHLHAEDFEDGLLLLVDFGEKISGAPVVSWYNMPLPAGQSVFEVVRSLDGHIAPSAKTGISVPTETMQALVRIGLSICFMARGTDDSVITPYVQTPEQWSRGRGKPKLLKPAVIRPHAFDVGKSFTVQPHWRSPSPLALYWTGKGRKIPRLRYRRGCVVHRKKVKVEWESKEEREG